MLRRHELKGEASSRSRRQEVEDLQTGFKSKQKRSRRHRRSRKESSVVVKAEEKSPSSSKQKITAISELGLGRSNGFESLYRVMLGNILIYGLCFGIRFAFGIERI
ncbi:hypothetical protein Dsin_003887 [Dipteronia sinensis]|uniref:Uncharacterized protein n=1 Tax=Dipteronia sinensis TaxID=43782 RepID=A0AAE0B8X1_9ROSI|nr:hypothetical protein Dsin_003887 [Dipteronia sinensis]